MTKEKHQILLKEFATVAIPALARPFTLTQIAVQGNFQWSFVAHIPTKPSTGLPIHFEAERIPGFKEKSGNPLSSVFTHTYITPRVPEVFHLRRGRLCEIE